jgi:hypothetical protein
LLIKKEKNVKIKLENMQKLSNLIKAFIEKDHSEKLLVLQRDLWDKYNKDKWLEKL